MPHQQKVVLLLIAHIHHNLFQIFLSQFISVVLKLVIIFLGLPLVIDFVQLFHVVELGFELRLSGLLAVNFLSEDSVDQALDFLVRGQVQVGHAEDWLLDYFVHVADLFVFLRLQKLIHSFSFQRVEFSFIILVLLVVIISGFESQGSVNDVKLILGNFGLL